MRPLIIPGIIIIFAAIAAIYWYISERRDKRKLEKFTKDLLHLDVSMGWHVEPDRDAICGRGYGEPVLKKAFEPWEVKKLNETMYARFIASMRIDERASLPKTPETCPNCGAKYSGGATAPGDDMELDLRVFYMCGASIALKKDENGKHVMLKNCSSLEEPVIRYPILCRRLVKAMAGTPTQDGNPLAEKAKERKTFRIEIQNIDKFMGGGDFSGNSSLLPRSEIDKAIQETMDHCGFGGSRQEDVPFLDKTIGEMTVHVDPGTAETTVFSIGRPGCSIPLKRDVLIPGRSSGSVSITKMKHLGESVVRSKMKEKGQFALDSVISLKRKLKAAGITPEIVLLAPDVLECLSLNLKIVPYKSKLEGLPLVSLKSLPKGALYVTTIEEANNIVENLSKPASGEPIEVTHEKKDLEEDSGH